MHLRNINMSWGNNQHAWGDYHISPHKNATNLRSNILEFDDYMPWSRDSGLITDDMTPSMLVVSRLGYIH
eukprot:scaffold161764_cov73-Attheya_sp.AAC.1